MMLTPTRMTAATSESSPMPTCSNTLEAWPVGPAASACALLRDRAEIGPGRFPQSEAIPDTAAATGKAISARIGHRGAVSPVWMRMEIIRDEFSNASGFTRNWANPTRRQQRQAKPAPLADVLSLRPIVQRQNKWSILVSSDLRLLGEIINRGASLGKTMAGSSGIEPQG